MSTLIIGGLFVVALLAIVAIVFVLRSERPSPQTTTLPTDTKPDNTTISQPVVPSPVSHRQAVAEADEPNVARQETRPTMENGQFHELSIELHTLHEQAQEIEHRLSVLSEMIERVEGLPDAHTNIAEEYSSIADRQSAN